MFLKYFVCMCAYENIKKTLKKSYQPQTFEQ